MHLAIDAVGAKFGGTATVLLDLLNAAIINSRVKQITVFTSPREFRRFDLPTHAKLTEIEVARVDRSRIERLRWSLHRMGNLCNRFHVDIVLCLGNIGRATIPCVVFIQQSLPFSPEALSTLNMKRKAEMVFIKEMMRYSCKNAAHVLVQTPIMVSSLKSAFELQDERISYIMPSVRLPSRQIDSDQAFASMFDCAPIDQRILYVGTDSSYKMLPSVLRGLRLLREKFPFATLFLTLPQSHSYCDEAGVVCCGYLHGAALRHAYEQATVLVMPSLTETVGLPMLEALSVGTPVIASDRPYAHFACEDSALYFEPHNPASLSETFEQILTDPQLREQLSANALRLAAKRASEMPYSKMIDLLLDLAREQ